MSLEINQYKRGFNRRESDTMGDITWTESTRKFTISPKAGQPNFYFYSRGKLFTKTTTQSVIIPNVSGIYYTYFDTNGVLKYILNSNWTEDLFKEVAIVGLCYWNATKGNLWNAIDEQHGIIMDSATHFRLHLVEGAKWMQGATLNGFVDGDSTYTSISTGVFSDEDITFLTPEALTHSFMYRDGVNGDWLETSADNKIGHIVSGDTYCSWNEDTGSGWKLTECTNTTDYVIMFVLWTNFTNSPIKKVIGTQTYPSRNAARLGLKDELTAINLSGLSTTESVFIAAYILKRNGDLEDDGSGNAYVDLRSTKGYNLPE